MGTPWHHRCGQEKQEAGDFDSSSDQDEPEASSVPSKLELGTWSERMDEMLSHVNDSKSSDSMNKRVDEIKHWWGLTLEFLEKNSSSLGAAVRKSCPRARSQMCS